MFAQSAITLGAWLVLLFVSTNLVGFLVRGLSSDPEMDKLQVEGNGIINGVIQEHRQAGQTANIVVLALIPIFLAALYHFWNVGVALAATMLMTARVTDVVWEIRYGRKLRLRDMRLPALWLLNTALSWVSLPVLWYALYRM